ncbi:MAG: hypothetical protein ABI763_02620 [Bacteroidota bacterium]
MKKIILFMIALLSNILINTVTVDAQVIVKIRPETPRVVARPAMRGRGMVWIEPEWYWNKHQRAYAWREGRWMKPRHHAEWVPGHWIEAHEGYNWTPGYWGRRR